MNHDEKQMISGLFGRLQDAERSAPPRDADAERFIQERVSSQPGAPYYMAQTIIVQEQALEAAQARIQELEQGGARQGGGGGLFGGLFGGGRDEARRPSAAMGAPAGYGRQAEAGRGGSPWGGSQPGVQQAAMGRGGGGGFLAGAAQTAVGVAGGMMLGSMLGGMFSGGAAEAGEVGEAGDTGGEDMAAADDFGAMDDGGGFEEF